MPLTTVLFAGLAVGIPCLVVALERAQARAYGVPPVPSLPWLRRNVVRALRRHAPAARKIAELGSGWGGLAFALAQAFPAAQVTGFELSGLPYGFAQARAMIGPPRNIKFRKADFLTQDLSDYDVAVCYLLPRVLRDVPGRLPAGCLLVAAGFPLKGVTPQDQIGGPLFSVYIYKIPS
ncbi:MAG TPA: hypothetical protein DDX54_06350 [Rhodospirillaceae bacterium]|nr:methyltransferase domain-containing protein [Alphaproteobacteria bacterium]HBH27005.1 hypothetical protein [Rhodospirillaceae bacterium]